MDGGAPVSGLWVPTLRAPTAAGTPRTRPRKRSVRSGALPFFQLRPALLHPLVDGFVVAFGRTTRRPLPTPAQAFSENVPHARRVIRHPGDPLDHLGHTLQRPQLVRIAIRFGTFGQLHL